MTASISITNFAEAEAVLRPYYNTTRTPYTLDAMRALMDWLGNPQQQLRVVHIAGTSGKTSTAYYCAALLGAAGASVGLSVSPHVDCVNERLQVNGQPLPEAQFCQTLAAFLALIADCPVQPSYFELMAAMAYWEFARQGLDYAVMEVGLGGLLDATNVVQRPDKVCVITDIGFDHTEILGDTLAAIATQKAGIITPHNPTFMYEQLPEVMTVVRATAEANDAPLATLAGNEVIGYAYLPLFQQRNLCLAARAVSFLQQRDGLRIIDDVAVSQAAHVVVPARMERLAYKDKLVLLDGAHNAQKMSRLVGSVQQAFPKQPVAVMASFMNTKSNRWQEALTVLAPIANYMVFTTFEGDRDIPKPSVSLSAIEAFCNQQHIAADYQADLALALDAVVARPEPVVLITGSFYVMHQVRQLLQNKNR